MLHDNDRIQSALKLFDYLDPVSSEFMLGSWHGASYPTGHPLDGLLENYHWHGKRFESTDEVYPLLFRRRDGRLANVNPALLKPALAFMNKAHIFNKTALARAFQTLVPAFATDKAKAHLTMQSYRGKDSATMVYNQLPVRDVFRRIDDNTVFAMMDYSGLKQPYFFFLKRDT